MNLEPASESDLAEILQLQKKAFYGQALIYNDFTLPPLLQTVDDLKTEFQQKYIFKMEENGRIVASVRCFIKDDTLYIEKLMVDPDFQNKGIGTKLMLLIEDRYSNSVARYTLFTGHRSKKNLHLYRNLGYREIRQEIIRDDLILIYMEKSNIRRNIQQRRQPDTE